MFEDILKEFNKVFDGKAKAVIQDGRLLITIGNITMTIQLPSLISVKSTEAISWPRE